MSVVYVTRAQRLAARILIRRYLKRGIPVRPAVQRIAEARATTR